MCIYIRATPTTLKDSVISKVHKQVNNKGPNKQPETFYRGTSVPTSGWLIPKKVDDQYPTINETMDINYIHFYVNNPTYYPSIYGVAALTSFALGVVAFNNEHSPSEGICRALYIPSCDTNKTRRSNTTRLLQNHYDYIRNIDQLKLIVPTKIASILEQHRNIWIQHHGSK